MKTSGISNRKRIHAALLPLVLPITHPSLGSARAQQSTPAPASWSTEGWDDARPEDHGLPDDLAAQIDQMVAETTPLLTSLLVVRGGNLIIDNHYNDVQPEDTFNLWSIATNVTTIAVGIALREGLLTSLDQTLGELIPDRIPADADPRVPSITLQHLLTSTSGWVWDARIDFTLHPETDDLDSMLARPMGADPGESFEYDSTNANLLSVIIQTLSGVTMAEYLQSRLFDPLGIPTPEWETMTQGETRGSGGLFLTPADLAKIGYLSLNNGTWEGQEIVTAEWVAESTTEHATGTSEVSDINIGDGAFGYQWWIKEPSGYPSYYGNGYGGQTLYVVPDLDLVVVTAVAGTDVNEPENQQPVLPIIEDLIIPAAAGEAPEATALATAAATGATDSTGEYWPTEEWRTANPDEHGLPADLASQIDQMVANTAPLLTSLLVVRGGDLVVDNHYNGFAPDDTFHIWSVTKSVTTIAVGIAFREGLLTSLDQTLGELIPDRIPAEADPRVPTITLQQLLTSTSGWVWDARTNFSRHDETDDLEAMLARPMYTDPGGGFEYDSTNTNLLSYIVQSQSGEIMADYLQPRLFDPLGIPAPEWTAMYQGETRGAGGLFLTPADMTKIGYLYLRNGTWDGQQFVTEEWVGESTRTHASGTGDVSGVNIGSGASYGYQWWVKEPSGYDAFFGNGYGGQTLYVVPELDLVISTAVAGTDVNEPENQQPVIPIIEDLVIASATNG